MSSPSAVSSSPWGRRRAESISSLQSSHGGSYRRQRSPSSARIVPQSQQQQQQNAESRLSSSITSASHREPIRSFIHLAHRDHLAPVSTAEYARSVREDTAELAIYQLADKTDGRNPFLGRTRSLSCRTAFSSDADLEDVDSGLATFGSGAVQGSETIAEISEPESTSPEEASEPSPLARVSDVDTSAHGVLGELEADAGPSLLTRALRRSPPQRTGLFGADTANSDNVEDAEDADYRSEHVERGNLEHLGSHEDPEATHDSLRLTSSHSRHAHSPWPEADTADACRPTEATPLLGAGPRISVTNGTVHGHAPPTADYDVEGQKRRISHRLFGLLGWLPGHRGDTSSAAETGNPLVRGYRAVTQSKFWDRHVLWQNAVVAPIACLPAVIVGLLLNILDALSYGMILFPLGSPIFSHLGSAGISMFYVSTIVSQLVFSSKSIFKGGVGSELIEVVPFFHNMALTITDIVGEDDPDAVIATTITSYALAAMVTGSVFYLMGRFKFGYIVGFIPRHILIGCIGGVGWFLVATGFEVTARIDGSLEYNLDTLHKLAQPDTIPLWITPLALSIALFWGQKGISSKYFLPLYILAIPFLFYIAVFTVGAFNPTSLRSHGWVFEGPPAGEPWWFFYTLYKFDKVHWGAIGHCVPAMFALTFFGILHVPINVPALALNTGEDHADLDHELRLHGYSNILSGALGSIQNYLVYANTLFFMRSGGNSRLAGFELAFLTFCVMLVGPSIIGFIPIMMVGCLIFDLGFELLVEAVWEPRKKLSFAEFVTVIIIVLIMGIHDFVVGIGVGILLAFVSLIFQTSQVSAVRATYSGEIVTSTVRRNPSQQKYLRDVGRQTCAIKLAGYLFFGTIASVESTIRGLIAEEAFSRRPIRYVILDLRQVTGLDYSAGEAFNTISRLLNGKGIQLVLSGVDAESKLGHDLRAVGLGEDGIEVAFLPDINTALEFCENELLKTFYTSQQAHLIDIDKAGSTTATSGAISTATAEATSHRHLLANAGGRGLDMLASSPRRTQLQTAARELLDKTDGRRRSRWQNFSEPLRLMLQIFQDVSDKNEDFWYRATSYFKRREYAAGETLFRAGAAADGFYLLEKGMVRAEYNLAHGQRYHESIVAGTTCGELPFFSETTRTATAYAELDCTVWVLDREAWQRLQKDFPDMANELLRVSLKLTAERMSTVPSSTMLLAD